MLQVSALRDRQLQLGASLAVCAATQVTSLGSGSGGGGPELGGLLGGGDVSGSSAADVLSSLVSLPLSHMKVRTTSAVRVRVCASAEHCKHRLLLGYTCCCRCSLGLVYPPAVPRASPKTTLYLSNRYPGLFTC